MNITPTKFLLTLIAILIAALVALVAGMLTHSGGAAVADTLRDAGAAFAVTLGVVVLIFTTLGAL